MSVSACSDSLCHFHFPTLSKSLHSHLWRHLTWPMIFLPAFLKPISPQTPFFKYCCNSFFQTYYCQPTSSPSPPWPPWYPGGLIQRFSSTTCWLRFSITGVSTLGGILSSLLSSNESRHLMKILHINQFSILFDFLPIFRLSRNMLSCVLSTSRLLTQLLSFYSHLSLVENVT